MTVSLFASLSKTKAFSNEKLNEKEIQTFQGGSSLSSSFSTGAPPAFPPAIVQFYSNKFIDLNQLSINRTDPHSSLVAPLTYQSCNLSSFSFESYERRSSRNGTSRNNDSTTASNSNSSNVLGPRLDPADFGIWNCHMFLSSKSNATTSPSKLLQACHPLDSSKKSSLAGETGTRCIVPVFVVVLDLEYDNLGCVHSTMEAILENIVDYCMTYNPPSESSNDNSRRNRSDGTGTTRLKVLLNTRFGKAPLTEEEEEEEEEEKEDDGEIKAKDNENDDNKQQQKDAKEVYMHLIICGILSSKKDVTYREKQALNLVSYHLQKFASEVNCSLCYMRGEQDVEEEEKRKGMVDGEESTGEDKEDGRGGDGMDHVAEVVREDGFRPKGLSVVEFAKSICNVYYGDSSDVETVQDDLNAVDVNVTSSSNNGWHQQPSFYGPFDYDVDLINSVLLRGAGCPGVWNANTDSLWVALPSPLSPSSLSPLQNDDSVENHATKSSNLAKGDQEWLEKLAESVNVYAGTTSGGASEGKSVKSSMDQTIRTTRTSANSTVATKKKVVKKKPSATGDKKGGDSQDVQDFFAGLLNK